MPRNPNRLLSIPQIILVVTSLAIAFVALIWVEDIPRATPQATHTATVVQNARDLGREGASSVILKLDNGQTATLSLDGKTAPATGSPFTYYERASDRAVSATAFGPTHPYETLGRTIYLVFMLGGFMGGLWIPGILRSRRRKRERAAAATVNPEPYL